MMSIKFTNTNWTNTEIQSLRDLIKKGETGRRIASILKRTLASVQSKIYGMKMSIKGNRPPLSNKEFNKRYKKHMENKQCQEA